MKQKVFTLLCICLLCISLTAGAKPGDEFNFTVKGDGAGYTLLYQIVDTFQNLSASGKGGRENLEHHLYKWWEDAKKARSENLVDQEFYSRYKRLLVVIVYCTLMDEKNIILESLIQEEIGKFDIPKRENNSKIQGLGSIASALSEEILSLKKYLDRKTGSKKR
jgi:hypothetical protein